MKVKVKVKKLFCLFLVFVFLFQIPAVYAESAFKLPYDCTSYILIDETSGKILVEENIDEKVPIASLTKIMELDVVAELIEKNKLSLDDVMITTSQHARDVTGSKIYLEVGEKMTLRNMLIAIALPSANDASVAVAEYFAGTEEEFVELMNKKANQLGMTNTHFVNACGLHDDNHYSSARDIAIVARDLLLNHPWIKDFTSVYSTDPIREGGIPQYNTNKLVRFYKGCTGLKTGHHDEAGYCLCASATRGTDEDKDKMNLISVCLGIPISVGKEEGYRAREENCKYLLDYGFSSFKVLNASSDDSEFAPVEVLKGKKQFVSVGVDEKATPILVKKGSSSEIEKTVEISEKISAPIEKGQTVGHVKYILDGKEIAKQNLIAKEKVEKVNFIFLFGKIIKNFFLGEEF